MNDKQQFSVWYVIGAMLLVVAANTFLFGARHTETLAYSDFKALAKAGRVSDVVITEEAISGRLSSDGLAGVVPAEVAERIARTSAEHFFVTTRVDDPPLAAELQAAGVRYSGRIESRLVETLLSWVLPALVFAGLWGVLMRRMGSGAHGLLEIGKSKAKVYLEKQTGVSFADVAGVDEARDELAEIVEFLRSPQRYQRLGGRIPKGILIVGAPGTGKTLLAKAVAGEAGVPFITISGSDFVEMFVGVGAARVRDLFAQGERHAPCIIFIDELDALGKARGVAGLAGGGNDEREQTLNQLLVEMDGFSSAKGVLIMAATNRPEILDAALLRPGRFDRHIAIDRPDLAGRCKILDVHVRRVALAPGLDLDSIAARTPGFAGADLANLVNEAALHAARAGKAAVEMADFEAALDRIVGGLERRHRVMNATERQTVAYHEAGHALAAESRPSAGRVAKVSIIPRGIAALGYTQQVPTEDRWLLRRSELLDRIDVLLAGRVAEELVFGDVSTGAQNDLARATDIARHMVTQYGMSERAGLAVHDTAPTPAFLPEPAQPIGRGTPSEASAELIDAEVGRLLAEAHARTRTTLLAQRGALDAIAAQLLAHETLDRAALRALIEPPATAAPRSGPPAVANRPARSLVTGESAP